jgi:eukaryotic-like serine/threonine-protein kinase
VTDYLLAGRYRLTDRIAAGGMGEVWRGVDQLLNRRVAVKLLSAGRANDGSFLARFRAEARYSASLSHSGIARVYDYGESAEFGGAYLVMELVDGEPLSAILARAGRLSPEVTLDIIAQAARALDAAHQAGIVHRDIKPGNLLLAAGGQVKLTDFGIATAVRASQATHLTETGMVMGTAMYVSPEQATGAPVTASSDIYSLGVLAYECLAGRPPFTAREPLAIAYAHKHDPVPPLPPDVPQQAAALIYAMLAKTPEGRPPSARAVADRADVLRDALSLGLPAPVMGGPTGGLPAGQEPTRADLTARADLPSARPTRVEPAMTGRTAALRSDNDYGAERSGHSAQRRSPGSRAWATAGVTALICAVAAGVGFYFSSQHSTGSDPGNNLVANNPTSSQGPSPTEDATPSASPTPSVSTGSPSPSPRHHRSSPPAQPSKSASPTPTTTSPSATPTPTTASPSVTPTGPSTSPSTATPTATLQMDNNGLCGPLVMVTTQGGLAQCET